MSDFLTRAKNLHQKGDAKAAMPLYQQALLQRPNDPETLYYAAAAKIHLKDFKGGAALCDRLLKIKPDLPDALFLRGCAMQSLGADQKAVADFNKTIMMQPQNHMAHANLGIALTHLKRFDDAIASLLKAVKIKPDYTIGYKNLGAAYFEAGQIQNAKTAFEKSLSLKPNDALCHYNLGKAQAGLARFEEAIASYDIALRLHPGLVDARWNKSLVLLREGDFDQGWQLYESRWDNSQFTERKPVMKAPYWTGEAEIAGKSILLFSEQGLGDSIQFVRLARQLAEKGAIITLAVQKPLMRLCQQIEGVNTVIDRRGKLPKCDFMCSLMSLPLALGINADTPELARPYLVPDPQRVQSFKALLKDSKKPRIGLVWSGSATHTDDHNRSIALADIIRHLPKDCDFFCLQKDIRPDDQKIVTASPDIKTASDVSKGHKFFDFDDTAALCSLMDKIVTVDTSIAHLAGALGVPTIVMLSAVADFRWLRERQDSPWYSSVTLVRRRIDEDSWDRVISEALA
ncbi:MAG: tetratricopeptide repeat protein [Alphaproteobacteria bacterium]